MTRRSLWQRARGASVRVMKNLIWGGTWGLFFGVVYCAIGLLLRIGRGPDFLRGYGITFGQLMLLYAAAPIAGGLIVGLARPLTRWRAGAVIVGMMAAFVIWSGICMTLQGPVNRWHSDDWVLNAILAVVTGIYLGNGFWEDRVEPTLPPPELPPGPPPPRRPLGQW